MRIQVNGGNDWIDFEPDGDGYVIVDDSMTSTNDGLGFIDRDDKVTVLDPDSDDMDYFDISQSVEVNGIRIDEFGTDTTNLEALREAFEHFTVISWCPGDI